MKKYQQFTWKQFPPGTDYGNVILIEGPPGALRDALEDEAIEKAGGKSAKKA